MSFVYAEQSNIENVASVHIYSDTKLTFDDRSPNIANWGNATLRRVMRFGLVKSMIISPKCCLSFAGNDISYAHRLLSDIFIARFLENDELLSLALSVHKEAGPDKCEFIICLADDEDNVSITCIKNGEMHQNCPQAWIGSYDTFYNLRKQQEMARAEKKTPSIGSMIQEAIHEGHDPTVGGFMINVRYDSFAHHFVYSECLESSVEYPQVVKLGEKIRFYDDASKGGYTVYYRESDSDVIIDFQQADISVAYTNRYRYEEETEINEYTKHFMLPIFFKTSTGKVLDTI